MLRYQNDTLPQMTTRVLKSPPYFQKLNLEESEELFKPFWSPNPTGPELKI